MKYFLGFYLTTFFLIPSPAVGISENLTKISIGSKIEVSFNRDIKLGNGFISLVNYGDPSDSRKINVAAQNPLNPELQVYKNKLIIKPKFILSWGVYNLKIDPSAIKDMNNNSYPNMDQINTLQYSTLPENIIYPRNGTIWKAAGLTFAVFDTNKNGKFDSEDKLSWTDLETYDANASLWRKPRRIFKFTQKS